MGCLLSKELFIKATTYHDNTRSAGSNKLNNHFKSKIRENSFSYPSILSKLFSPTASYQKDELISFDEDIELYEGPQYRQTINSTSLMAIFSPDPSPTGSPFGDLPLIGDWLRFLAGDRDPVTTRRVGGMAAMSVSVVSLFQMQLQRQPVGSAGSSGLPTRYPQPGTNGGGTSAMDVSTPGRLENSRLFHTSAD